MPIRRIPAPRTDTTREIRVTLNPKSILALWNAFEGALTSDNSVAPEVWEWLEEVGLVESRTGLLGPAMRFTTQLGKDVVLDARSFDGWKSPFDKREE